MGLQHMMTHRQASKKWENLKKRYKVQFFVVVFFKFISAF